MSALVVVATGAMTTLQDGGRIGAARYGVPRSGPVDRLSHRLAARLAGVAPSDVARTVAIEVGPQPCIIAASGGTVTIAVAGAGVVVTCDGTDVPAPCVLPLADGQECTITAPTWGYVVTAADIEVPATLGSRSHHPRSGLGPALSDGTRLPLGAARAVQPGRRQIPTTGGPSGVLDVLAAPQTDLFTPASLAALTEQTFRTTTAFDRMGHRVDGPGLATRGGHDIVSDGIVPGALQVPGDGQPYVLTADHQTTGGYPKVAVLSTEALARFVRLPPGSPVRFAWADVATARARLQAAVGAIEDVVAGPVTPIGAVLRAVNLIDGVTDGGGGGS